jgi:hypothetical protein
MLDKKINEFSFDILQPRNSPKHVSSSKDLRE